MINRGGHSKAMMSRIGSNKLALVASLAAVAALALTTSLTLGGFSAGISNSTSTFSSATIQLEEIQRRHLLLLHRFGHGRFGHCDQHEHHLHDQRPHRNSRPGTGRYRPHDDADVHQRGQPQRHGRIAGDGSLHPGDGIGRQRLCRLGHLLLQQGRRHCRQHHDWRHRQVRLPDPGSGVPGAVEHQQPVPLAGQTYNAVPLTVLAAGASATYVVTDQLDSGVATNADQGLTATLPFTWSIAQ